MEIHLLNSSLSKLKKYCEFENFKGYDPYDTLNSFIPFHKIGLKIPAYVIQVQKRNPLNIRPILGIKKGYNPKALGLLLKAYSILYSIDNKNEYLDNCSFLYQKILELKSEGFNGYCWGYNFDWANPGNYLKKFTPSAVVTGFVIDGLVEYSNITKAEEIKKIVISSCNYLINDLPQKEVKNGLCFGYTHKSEGCCYNANLLTSETLAKAYYFTNEEKYIVMAKKAVNFVLSKQKQNGSWNYSINYDTGIERKQIDFHQGFILVSLYNYVKFTNDNDKRILDALIKGLEFFKNNQFYESGQSLWRLPKKYPVEIHNQAQGILTFSLLNEFNSAYLDFAEKIANWTIENMQDPKGFFYYRNYRFYKNKIPFMRWSQSWMMLALGTLKKSKSDV